MGITEKMGNLSTRVQDGTKNTLSSIAMMFLKLFSGAVLGLTLGLVVRELARGGFLVLLFVALVTVFAFMKVSSKWSLGQLFIFDLICILVGMLLRMYIVVAP